MFARVTKYKTKPDSIANATALLNTLQPRIMGLPGVQQVINVIDADGHGYVISLSDSEAVADANAAKVAEIWAGFAPYLEAPPTPRGFDVTANWSN